MVEYPIGPYPPFFLMNNSVSADAIVISTSLIQSDFKSTWSDKSEHGNFEAVVLNNQSPIGLVHYTHDNSEDLVEAIPCKGPSVICSPWKLYGVIAPNAAAAGSIIQSDFKSSNGHGYFEVVVPLAINNGERYDLYHYRHDNSDPNNPWEQGQCIAQNVAGPGCIIQSDFKSSNGHGYFEVVVPLYTGDTSANVYMTGSVDLYHYRLDTSDVKNNRWEKCPSSIAQNVAGPGCIIQSDFKSNGSQHGNFEVVVPLWTGNGIALWHYRHDNPDMNNSWQQALEITKNAGYVTGPGVIIQSDFQYKGHGNLEVVVPIMDSLVHFWYNVLNPQCQEGWQPWWNISDVVTGGGCIIQSDFKTNGVNGNFEALVPEYQLPAYATSHEVACYFHENSHLEFPWLRWSVVIGAQAPVNAGTAVEVTKVCQLTGEYDQEGWVPDAGADCVIKQGQSGAPNYAFNRTESQFVVKGCDLGASFEHDGKLYFLFGDTSYCKQPTYPNGANDSIAWTELPATGQASIGNGISLTFNKQPPLLPNVNQGALNVPVAGFSWNGAMYVFFTTDAYAIDSIWFQMGRSVLGRSTDGGNNFEYIGPFSNNKFINVSVALDEVDDESAPVLGLDKGTPVLWIWGTGRWRMSAVYLAVLPLTTGQDISSKTLAGVRYFAGHQEWSSKWRPTGWAAACCDIPNFDVAWSTNEADATPLLPTGDVGELSISHYGSPLVGLFLLLFNSKNPRGIVSYSAPNPWGPWAGPRLIFNPGAAPDSSACSGPGYGKFMHVSYDVAECDHVQDDMMILCQKDEGRKCRDHEWGVEYGPYQIARYAHVWPAETIPEGATFYKANLQIYFTMSTWNPYQTMLMKAQGTFDVGIVEPKPTPPRIGKGEVPATPQNHINIPPAVLNAPLIALSSFPNGSTLHVPL